MINKLASLSRPAQAAIIASAMLLLLTGGLAGSYGVSVYVSLQTARQLCGIIRLMTAQAPPKPSGANDTPLKRRQYEFYEQSVRASRSYHC